MNHRVVERLGLEGTSKIIQFNPLLQAQLPTAKSYTRWGCPVPHPARPWTSPGMGICSSLDIPGKLLLLGTVLSSSTGHY